jgi:hypothetical protein
VNGTVIDDVSTPLVSLIFWWMEFHRPEDEADQGTFSSTWIAVKA